MWATQEGKEETVKLLLGAKADITMMDSRGRVTICFVTLLLCTS
jgi:hypothetical protein